MVESPGLTRPADQNYDGYRLLSDNAGAEVRLSTATPDWLVPGRNRFGVYVYTPRVDAIAELMRDEIVDASRRPEHEAWGTYELTCSPFSGR